MKRLLLVLLVLLILAAPAAALAAPPTQAPSQTSGGSTPPPSGDNIFSIDNTNTYPGMDKSYSAGYFPIVANGVARVVLPLTTSEDITGGSFNITVDLGDAQSSPFVFGNYDRSISVGQNGAYVVDLELPLTSERMNGRYPVTINAQGKTKEGAFTQHFTVYVTIVDGKDPNATPTPEPTPTPQKEEVPRPQPKIMVSNYTVNPSPVVAGEPFEVSITLLNTNESQAVNNVKITASTDSEGLLFEDETTSHYFKTIPKKGTVTISYKMRAGGGVDSKPQKLALAIGYEGHKAAAFTSEESITIPVKQSIRLEYDEPKIPNNLNAGDTITVSLNIMNMGKGTVRNVRISLESPGLIMEKTAFLGNIESGTAKKGDMYVFVGTKDMTDGADKADDKYGYTGGKVLLVYEDEFGEEYSEEFPFETNINPPVIQNEPQEEEEEKKEDYGQWWISIIVVGVAIAGILTWRYLRKKKQQQQRDENEDA